MLTKEDFANYELMTRVLREAYSMTTGYTPAFAMIECPYNGLHASVNFVVENEEKVRSKKITPHMENLEEFRKILETRAPEGMELAQLQIVRIYNMKEEYRVFQGGVETNSPYTPRWQARFNRIR